MSSSHNKRRKTAVDQAVRTIEDAIDSAADAEECKQIRRRLKFLLEEVDAKLAGMGREAVIPAPPMAAVAAARDGSASSRSSVVSPLAVPQAEERRTKSARFKDDGVWGDYVGDIDAKGRRHGRGKITYENGNVYDGEWKNDKQEGQGKRRWPNGDEYVGGWKNGKMVGQGKCRRADGDEYEGEFKNDKHEGQGKFLWADGEEYEGGWKNDKQEGRGIYRYADGRIEVGGWKAGKCSGQGVRWSKDRQTAWLLNDGKVDRQIGLPEAKATASLLGFRDVP